MFPFLRENRPSTAVIFWFPKKDRRMHPILDLCCLNFTLRTYKFKMLTLKLFMSQILTRFILHNKIYSSGSQPWSWNTSNTAHF